MIAASEAQCLLRNSAPVLRQAIHVWSTPQCTLLTFDHLRGHWAAPNAQATVRGLYGNTPARWVWSLKHALRQLRETRLGALTAVSADSDIPLPSDAVLIPRPVNHGIVVASAQSNRVVKVSHGTLATKRLRNEFEAYRASKSSKNQLSVPAVLEFNELGNGTSWLCEEFAWNTHPLLAARILRWGYWRRFVRDTIASDLFSYYRSAGCVPLTVPDWFHSLKMRLQRHPARKVLRRVLMLAEAAAEEEAQDSDVVLTSRIHGDFFPEHIHRSRHHWKLIDWGNSCEAPIILDWFADLLLFSLPPRYELAQRALARWLRGDASTAPRTSSHTMRAFYDLQEEHLGLRTPARAWRYQLLAGIVEMHCSRFDVLGFNPGHEIGTLHRLV